MMPESSFVAAPRPEQDLAGWWGIYSACDDRWIDVVFASRREADESADRLRKTRGAPRV